MTSFNKYSIIHIICLFALQLNAQVDKDQLKVNEANAMFDKYAFVDARQIYLEVANNGFVSEDVYKKLGDSYYFNSDLKNANKWYQKLFDLKNGELNKDYLFRYAMSLKGNKQYELSDQILLKLNQFSDKDSRYSQLEKEKNYLNLIDLQSGRYEISSLDFNSSYSDASVAHYDGVIFYASNKPNSGAVKRIHGWNNKPYYEIYTSTLDSSYIPSSEKSELVGININSKFHELSPYITKDGLTLYFSRNNFTNNKYLEAKDGVNKLKIYRSTRASVDDNWGLVEELPFNNNDYNTSHPTLNANEDTMYFISDMEGTRGMSDIFKVSIDTDGNFGTPEPLGSHINTEGRENFPFIIDEKLFFSSDGHLGLGGLDVFVTDLSKQIEIQTVINAGRPINSPEDDFAFYMIPETKRGFFSSNRPGGKGDDDIYALKELKPLIASCNQYVKGIVKSKETQEQLNEVTISLFNENLEFIEETTTDASGFYELVLDCNEKYIVRATKSDYEVVEQFVESGVEFEKNFELSLTLKKGNSGILDVQKVAKGDDLKNILQLQRIYFDTDQWTIRKDAEIELQKVIAVLKKYPEMKIDVRSHTDSRSDYNYNMNLSEKRAISTLNYIVKNGVDKSRVGGKGYGESELLNNCKDGVPCSDEDHQQNRRSEFIVLNENQTPQNLRSSINKRVIASNIKDNTFKWQTNENLEVYDFSQFNESLTYTVQIAASSVHSHLASFNNIDAVYYFDYADGYRRYYSGQFLSKERAIIYKNYLKDKGYSDVWIVKLKGNKRL